jgi:hypothetical protein
LSHFWQTECNFDTKKFYFNTQIMILIQISMISTLKSVMITCDAGFFNLKICFRHAHWYFESNFDTNQCKFYTKNVILTHLSVILMCKMWFNPHKSVWIWAVQCVSTRSIKFWHPQAWFWHTKMWFWHPESNFVSNRCELDKHKSDLDTLVCIFDTHE